jgi:clan AA aspartic protease (TIGR02281 family)
MSNTSLFRQLGTIISLICFAAGLAAGDEILLKSGGKVNGIITARENGAVTVNMGFGSTTIDTCDIASIAISPDGERKKLQKQWKNNYPENTRPPLSSVASFVTDLRELRALRNRAVTRKKDLARLKTEIDSLELVMRAQTGEYPSINAALETLEKKEIVEQVRIVGKANQYNASVQYCRQMVEEKKADYANGNPALLYYIDSLSHIDKAFAAFSGSNNAGNAAAEIDEIASKLQLLKSEFKTAAIDVTFIKGNNILVEVVINNSKRFFLIVDTGASQVVLSQKCAERLGIAWQSGIPVKVFLANGQEETGFQVMLKSVSLDKFKSTNVSAVIMKNPPGPGVDGLLGMSYLRNYLISIDGINKKLMMREFKE